MKTNEDNGVRRINYVSSYTNDKSGETDIILSLDEPVEGFIKKKNDEFDEGEQYHIRISIERCIAMLGACDVRFQAFKKWNPDIIKYLMTGAICVIDCSRYSAGDILPNGSIASFIIYNYKITNIQFTPDVNSDIQKIYDKYRANIFGLMSE